MINALRVAYAHGGVVWCTDDASISQFGRVEATASFAVDTEDAAERLGDLFIASRAWPEESHVYRLAETSGKWIGDDVKVGDTATIAGEERRLVEVRWDLDSFGQLRASAPGFATSLRARRAAEDAKIAQIIAAEGSTASGSTRVELGPGAVTGKVAERQMNTWSMWDDEDWDDPEEMQASPVGEPVRISRIVALARDISGATTQTRVRLMINGAEATTSPDFGSIPTDCVLTSTDAAASTDVYGHSVIMKGSHFGLKLVSWGGHKRVSFTVFGADPL